MIAAPEEIKAQTARSRHAAFEFAVHCLIGTALFGVIAVLAVGINLSIRVLQRAGVDPLVIAGLSAAEYLLFGADLILFAVYLYRSALRTFRSL